MHNSSSSPKVLIDKSKGNEFSPLLKSKVNNSQIHWKMLNKQTDENSPEVPSDE